MRAGQAAIEYLAIIGFVLLASAPLVMQAQESTSALQTSTDRIQTSDALDTISEAANLVYSQGDPAKITFPITFPASVSSTTVEDDYIKVRVTDQYGPSDMVRGFSFNVTGSIPAEQGKHVMVVTAVGDANVSITPQ